MIRLAAGVAAGIVMGQISILISSIYLHRFVCHRAFGVSKTTAELLRVVNAFATGLEEKKWVALHRIHHRYHDTEKDPHRPEEYGPVRLSFSTGKLMANVRQPELDKWARDIESSSWWLRRTGFIGFPCAMALALGIPGAIAATIAWWLMAKLGGGILGYYGHAHRERLGGPTRYGPIDRPVVALLTWGEGFHDSHHAHPHEPDFGLRERLDPGFAVIRTIQRVDRRLASS